MVPSVSVRADLVVAAAPLAENSALEVFSSKTSASALDLGLFSLLNGSEAIGSR